VAALQRTSSDDDSDSHFSSFGNLLWSRIITLPTGSRFTPTISAMAAAAAAAVRALLAARCSVATRWTCGGFLRAATHFTGHALPLFLQICSNLISKTESKQLGRRR
jgi:hypothetical protein